MSRWALTPPPGDFVGADAVPPKKNGPATVAIVLGLAVGIYALSPGARHYYRTGRLPE